MVLDLTDNSENKTKEQHMDEAWTAIKARLKIQAIQNRMARDFVRSTMLESPHFTPVEINVHIGTINSNLLSDMDS